MKNMAKYTLKKPRKRKTIKKTPRQLKIERAIAEWDVLSQDLSPQQKLALARKIRGSGKLPQGMQHLFRVPQEADYREMALVCSKAIVARNGNNQRSDRVNVIVRLPYFFRERAKDFPIGRLVDADMLTQTFEINANYLLTWLYEKGYSDFDSKTLRKELGVFQRKLAAFENEFALINAYAPDEVIFSEWEKLMKQTLDNEGE